MVKKMQRILKNTIYLILILLLLTGCQSVKDGLTGQKKNNTDEFLVQKKNPLVQPPEFNDLPKPYSKKIDEDGKEDIDLSGVLTKKKY